MRSSLPRFEVGWFIHWLRETECWCLLKLTYDWSIGIKGVVVVDMWDSWVATWPRQVCAINDSVWGLHCVVAPCIVPWMIKGIYNGAPHSTIYRAMKELIQSRRPHSRRVGVFLQWFLLPISLTTASPREWREETWAYKSGKAKRRDRKSVV